MATTKKRFVFHADPDLAAWLEQKSRETGAPIAELIRRALTFVQKVNVGREAKPPELQWVNSLQVPDEPLFTSAHVDEIVESSAIGIPAKRPTVRVVRKGE
jgi:hypothetical protein